MRAWKSAKTKFLPLLCQVASELGLEEGIEGVSMGRQVEERRTVAQVCICSGLCSDSRAQCWVQALFTRVEARRTIGQVLLFEVTFDTRAFQNGNTEGCKSAALWSCGAATPGSIVHACQWGKTKGPNRE